MELLKNPFIRLQRGVTSYLGPKYRRSRDMIEIDITYICNLQCNNCNRSVKQAPTKDMMSVSQIESFIKESKNRDIKWKHIRILGGEPLLHPDLEKILELLLNYKRQFSNDTDIVVCTNGIITDFSYDGVLIENSSKTGSVNDFEPFNIAPVDSKYFFSDFRNACKVTSVTGIGLSCYGYYPCAVAASIDRVFGFNKGRKSIPLDEDDMYKEMKLFCSLCGHFMNLNTTSTDTISRTWKKAYKKYAQKKPVLDRY